MNVLADFFIFVLVMINEYEAIKEKLRRYLHSPINDENKIMNLLSRQHDAKRKYVKFLKIELGLEAFFQITGTFYYTF